MPLRHIDLVYVQVVLSLKSPKCPKRCEQNERDSLGRRRTGNPYAKLFVDHFARFKPFKHFGVNRNLSNLMTKPIIARNQHIMQDLRTFAVPQSNDLGALKGAATGQREGIAGMVTGHPPCNKTS